MKKIATLLLLISAVVSAQYTDTIFVNPSANDPHENGTIEHPYNSYADFSFTSDMCVRQMEGTVYGSGGNLRFPSGITNFKLTSYPDNAESYAVLHVGLKFDNCSYVTVENFEISGLGEDNLLLRGIHLQDHSSHHNTFRNLFLEYCSFGMSIEGSYQFYYNVDITWCDLDGIVMTASDSTYMYDVRIWDINKGWHVDDNPMSGGDNIQAIECNNVHIDNCYLDHASTANKFCIISSGYNNNWLIENSTMIAPLLTDPLERGACLHIGGDSNIVVRNNLFKNSRSAYYSVSRRAQIYNNVFDSCVTAIAMSSAKGAIYNNTFYNCETSISGGNNPDIQNNIFYFTHSGQRGISMNQNNISNNIQNMVADGIQSGVETSNPNFRDLAGKDFRLAENSPAIDAGANTGLCFDKDGNPRQETSIDVGAYEYQDGAAPELHLNAQVGNVGCFGAASGNIDLTVSGGTSFYSYQWSNGSTSQDLNDLAEGTYTVTVTDNNGTTSTETYIVNQPESAISIDGITTDAPNGSVDITVEGGSGSYSFLWSNDATTEDLLDVEAGSYTVTVTDVNNCATEETYVVEETIISSVENFSAENLAIYPNPTNGLLHINAKNGELIQAIQIHDISGKEVLYLIPHTENTNIDLSGYPNGIYLANVKIGSQTVSYKITKF
jgi:hypothetical protein